MVLFLVCCVLDLPDFDGMQQANNQGDDIVKEEEKVFDIIKDGTNLYTIVRPENASTLLARTAVSLNQYVLDQADYFKTNSLNVKEGKLP